MVYVKLVTPGAGPGAIFEKNLVDIHYMMLRA